MLAPERVSVPAPTLVRPPVPPMPCETVVLKLLVSIVPPPASSVIARVPARLKLAPSCSVPPLKVSPPLALPRLASLDTDSVPAFSVVPPE